MSQSVSGALRAQAPRPSCARAERPTAAPAAASTTPPPPPHKPFTLRRGRGKKLKTPNREFLRDLDRALPGTAGQGDYWRTEILQGREAYPPAPTKTPPRECERFGDRGRLYPGYYVRAHASALVNRGVRRRGFTCCLDCYNDVALRDRINFAIFCGEIVPDGRPVDAAEANAAAEAVLPESDGSASAAAIEQLANSGAELVESKLAPEDEASLTREIARYLDPCIAAGESVTTLRV